MDTAAGSRSAAPSSPPGYKYWAFISYSHQDNLLTRGDGSTDHIQWANWLHEQLETFVIPDGYRDRPTRTGEPMPERFFPAFRDEAELPTSHDLGGQIRDALERSRFLIVIASPRSARSRYVNEEVRIFRELGRGDRILVLITDGEPNVLLHPKPGWTAADDCFCPALVHPLKADGTVDDTQLLREEPIAADVRVKDVEPPREMRASECSQDDRRGLLDFHKLKLIAGLMGVGLDELVQRDKRRADEELRRVRREASRTEFLFARQLLDLKDYPKAYARLSKAIENDSENRAAAVLGLEEIRRRANCGALRRYLHQGVVRSAVFSPDGARILTASDDKTARLWDAATGQPLAESLRHERGVLSAVFSPDGARILTASSDNTARLWDTATGQPLAEPLRHEDWVWSAVFSPDGARILTASRDKTARLWDAATGQPLAEPLRHEGNVWSAVFSPDGARIVTASGDFFPPGCARIWDAATGQLLVGSLQHEGPVTSAVFNPDGARILTSSWDNTARLWDAATGQPLAEPLRHEREVRSAVFSCDGARILTASDDNTARLWDATTGQPLVDPLRHEDKVWSAVFSPDGARILTASADKTARLWDAASGQPLAESLRHEDAVWSAVFSPDGARIMTTPDDKTARLWDAAAGQPLPPLLRHEDKVRSAVFSPDGARILTASDDKTARLWDAATGQPLEPPFRHEGVVRSAVFSPDGARILTASDDKTARLWDAATGQPLAAPLRHESWVRSAVFSPEGARILTASEDKTARLWDAATGQPLAEPLRHEGGVVSAVFSPDGTRILTASLDNTARLWDATTGQPLADPLRHEDKVWSAMFSPDGARIVTASGEFLRPGCARIWDAATGQPLAAPLRHEGLVYSSVFSPDGARILTASLDHMARLWDAATGELLEADTGHLRRLLEISGGRRLNGRQLLEPVPHAVIHALRSEFDSDAEMNRLLRWWWSDPFTRTINPSSAITVPDYVRRRICEILDLEDEKAKPRCLQDARDSFPHHPLVLLCLAEQGKHGDPAWLRQHAVSRLLAEPHYLTPLEPPNAIGDAKANRQYELTLGLAEDCFLGARLLLNDRTGQTRTTDPKRIELAKQVLARALKLAPDNEAYRKLAAELGLQS